MMEMIHKLREGFLQRNLSRMLDLHVMTFMAFYFTNELQFFRHLKSCEVDCIGYLQCCNGACQFVLS
jgi:hypothetical protein